MYCQNAYVSWNIRRWLNLFVKSINPVSLQSVQVDMGTKHFAIFAFPACQKTNPPHDSISCRT